MRKNFTFQVNENILNSEGFENNFAAAISGQI